MAFEKNNLLTREHSCNQSRGGSLSPLRNPSRQLGQVNSRPKVSLALVLDAPLAWVMNMTASPMIKRPIHAGILSGGLAPSASANAGSHCDKGAGSSSTIL